MSTIETPLLELRHLKKSFGDKEVLQDINLSVYAGEIFCLIGQSGHGKSVILKSIMNLIEPTDGTILYKGTPIVSPETPPKVYNAHRSKFGLLFQGAALFDSLSVGENIAFSLREQKKCPPSQLQKIVADKLAMVGLEGVQDTLPSELSGGMKSRVGLARAVALEPEIMLYDEPTSALDPIMSEHIGDLIVELRKSLSMTSIVITHDVSLAYKIADKIAMLHNGSIIFYGTPQEIQQSTEPYIQQFLQLEMQQASFLRATTYDDLTDVYNRQQILTLLSGEKHRFLRYSQPTSALMIEVDNFLSITNTYGTPARNKLLQKVAASLKETIRNTDFIGRYSDSVFLVILPFQDATGSLLAAQRLQTVVTSHLLPDLKTTLTVSIGICNFSKENTDSITEDAIEMLEQAKKQGFQSIQAHQG